MKFNKLAYLIRNRGTTIAIFGQARLLKTDAGRITLEGGSLDDRRAAQEWCSLFLHTAAIDVRPDVTRPTTLNSQPSTSAQCLHAA